MRRRPPLFFTAMAVGVGLLTGTYAWFAAASPGLKATITGDGGDRDAAPVLAKNMPPSPVGQSGQDPAQPRTSATTTPPKPQPDLAAKLRENGAGTCAAQVNALGAGSMNSVVLFNTASRWAAAAADKRPVSVLIGQKYADGGAVPFGATGVFAAPNGAGTCDGLAVQVVPSPLPCDKLRANIAAHGRQIGDLTGVLLMEDASGQTMLVPTAGNACVLVGVRAAYAG